MWRDALSDTRHTPHARSAKKEAALCVGPCGSVSAITLRSLIFRCPFGVRQGVGSLTNFFFCARWALVKEKNL
jgi:hypothetical protein